MAAILFVDDEDALRRAVRRWFERRGIDVWTAKSVFSAKRCFVEHDDIRAAIIDVWLGDGTGMELFAWLSAEYPEVAKRVAFLTGGDLFGSPLADLRIETLDRPVLTKPFDFAQLERLTARWLADALVVGHGADLPSVSPPPP
ncbi:MAG: response regulator [Gemmatimonadota bacterium]|nr:response regulator [Gemmatimonadota bacterium]